MRYLLVLVVAFAVACSTGEPAPDLDVTEDETKRQIDDEDQDVLVKSEKTLEQGTTALPTWLEGCWVYQDFDGVGASECWTVQGSSLLGVHTRIGIPDSKPAIEETKRRIERDGSMMVYVEIRREDATETLWRFVTQDESSFEIERADGDTTIEYVSEGETLKITRNSGGGEEVIVAKKLDNMTEAEMRKAVLEKSEGKVEKEESSVDNGDAGIVVYSMPENLSIYVNGTDTGKKTRSTVDPGAGEHDIQVECQNGLTEVKPVTIAPGERKKLFFRCR